MKFKDTFYSKNGRYSLGVEEESGAFYISIPVTNGLVDYEEYYQIDNPVYQLFLNDEAAALRFAQKCRDRLMDHAIMIKPGPARGISQ